jgi:hypothetical protein
MSVPTAASSAAGELAATGRVVMYDGTHLIGILRHQTTCRPAEPAPALQASATSATQRFAL